ncbi:MAG: AarF/ABC1/UbiB kinase family protein [Lentisphaeria bacterium]|nr:AarF/ABC1/UbiB kinase family protein [Lentisphaeria bacterium]
MRIGNDLRLLRRFWFILENIASCGFREFVNACFPEKKNALFKDLFRKARSADPAARPARLRETLETLGPAFVKLGQVLSTRPDIVGETYAAELKKLTEHVTPFKFSEVQKIIEKETGRSVESIFQELDPVPLAAASIGQVHRGILRENGASVVVKVRRPGVVETIRQDLEILKIIALRMEQYGGWPARHKPVQIVEEFSHQLLRELDYMTEASNMTRFAADCAKNKQIKVPKVWFEYTASGVMTMEFIQGESAAKIQQEPASREKYDLKKIAENGVRSLLDQIFVAGFFHADPHPGNILILPDNRICFIDFGMMGRLGTAERRTFLRTLGCMLENDIPGMVDQALKMTVSSHFQGSRAALERDAADLVDANLNLPLERLSLARILNDLLQMLNRYSLALRPELYLMFKALMTIEHLGKDFDPQLKIVDMVRPFLFRVKVRELSPRRLAGSFLADIGDHLELIRKLPEKIGSSLCKLESGELSFRIEHHRLNDMEETLYITGERIARSLLLSALFVGSALIMAAKIPPLWYDIPLPGLCGVLISGVLSVYALWRNHRQRERFLHERAARKLEEELQRRKY